MDFPLANVLLLPGEVPNMLYRQLIILLSENQAWEQVANSFGIFSEHDIHVLRHHKQPAEQLVTELGIRLCNIEMLCQKLQECELFNALMLFRNHEPINIVEQPFGTGDNDTCMIERGRELSLTCRAAGLPPPSYQWFCGNEELPNQTTSLLALNDFNVCNEGEYYCLVSQEGYQSLPSNTVTALMAPEPPVFIVQPPGQEACRLGTNLTLSVDAQGHPPGLMYQWYKENRQLDHQTGPQLQIRIRSEDDDGVYRCYVRNECGEALSNKCRVRVYASPEDVEDGRDLRPLASSKMALLIANQQYLDMKPLYTPENDVKTVADVLRKLGFHVLALQNLTLVEMRNAVFRFSELVPKDAYVVFYFAGHGFELSEKFMLPIDAPGSQDYLRRDALCEKELLQKILAKRPKMLLELLDMCLKKPDPENKKIHSEKSRMFEYEANNNLIQGYSTTSSLGAYERKTEMNGLYVKHLRNYLMKDITIVSILDCVAKDIGKDSRNKQEKASVKQLPYYGTNVTGEFRLTDPCEPSLEVHDKVRQQMQAWWSIPEPCSLLFKEIGTETIVTCLPYKHVYHNTLHVHVSGLDRYRLECEAVGEELEFEIERTEDGRVIVVRNLQRLNTAKSLTLCLRSRQPQTDHVLDSAEWDMGKPMIAVADLWWPSVMEGDEPDCE